MSQTNIFKVITAGDGAVGKTTLLHRYVDGKFVFNTQMTLGVEIFTKSVDIGEKTIMLQLWDYGGQPQFRFMLDSYSLGCRGAFLMFDLTRYITIESIEEWVNICRSDKPDIPILLIGTKLDLVEDVMVADDIALEIKEKYGFIDYLKTSSKTGENVNKAFDILVKNILKRMNE